MVNGVPKPDDNSTSSFELVHLAGINNPEFSILLYSLELNASEST